MHLKEDVLLLKITKFMQRNYFQTHNLYQCLVERVVHYDSSLGVVSTAEYGKVFISIKSTTGLELTSAEKTQLIKDLAPYTIASTTPVIVDPLTTNLILNVTFKYNTSATTSTGCRIRIIGFNYFTKL